MRAHPKLLCALFGIATEIFITEPQACHIRQALEMSPQVRLEYCDREVIVTLRDQKYRYSFDSMIDQIFPGPIDNLFLLRSGEIIGALNQDKIVYLSKIDHLIKILPIANGNAISLTSDEHSSQITLLSGGGVAAVLMRASVAINDFAIANNDHIFVLLRDGNIFRTPINGQEFSESSSEKLENIPPATNIYEDGRFGKLYAVNSNKGNISICEEPGLHCVQHSFDPFRTVVVVLGDGSVRLDPLN